MRIILIALIDRFDGQLILPYMTPEELGMEDEDIIDVYVSRPSDTAKRALDDGEDQEGDRKRGMWFKKNIFVKTWIVIFYTSRLDSQVEINMTQQ